MEEENLDRPIIPDSEEHSPHGSYKPPRGLYEDLVRQGKRKHEGRPGFAESVTGAKKGRPFGDLAREVDEHLGIKSPGVSDDEQELMRQGIDSPGPRRILEAAMEMPPKATLRSTVSMVDRRAHVGKKLRGIRKK